MNLKSIIRTAVEPIRRNGCFDVIAAVSKGRVETVNVLGEQLHWLITNRNDEIQSHQIAHGFYEFAELEQLRNDIGPRARVLDIGANIGNHSVFFLKRMECRSLIAVEPYAPAARHLMINLAMNGDASFDFKLVGQALGNAKGKAEIVPTSQYNIGLTRIALGKGEVEVVTGDQIVAGAPLDLIKIDVEGMEVQVLQGLAETLKFSKPAIYVETSLATRDQVVAMLAEVGLRLIRETTAYQSQFNLTFLEGS